MQEHQTIFSAKEIKRKVDNNFAKSISNLKEKIDIVKNWQENIISGKIAYSKEEEIKPFFLTHFFGDILGYEYKNSTNWNLRLENKTELDSKKADAALGYFKIENKKETKKDVRVVIEIKDANNTLDKPQNRPDFKGSAVEQGFMYAAKSGEKCKWVIVSNFLEIRLYQASDMTKYERFDLLSLDDINNFSRFYYLLGNGQLFYENITSTIDILLQNRWEKEQNITKEFYEEYQYLREVFFQHLKLHNSDRNQLDLLQYVQTIIDRVIFVSVIKDYDLISYNVLYRIEKLADESWADDSLELWRQLKKFFKALDKGLPPRIHKFNGGLFRQNPDIDTLIIKDFFLKQLLRLNRYDFESDLSINVLGHIFEQSVTDIELLKKEITENTKIEYQEIDNEIIYNSPIISRNKRKKEGIYYTPENITLYIVENTIGTWLNKQKEQIGINNLADFPNNNKDKAKHIELWRKYQLVLNNIKILDPACGSGAFLTQAFDYLLKEHTIVNDVLDKLNGRKVEIKTNGLFNNAPTKETYQIAKTKKTIVNDNLFGVDLNPESVEITKLGLWLKSASKNDELALLDTNIKCGNSLINDEELTDKAFNWQKEFETIIDNGGFDVIVGNPPYIFIRELLTKEEKDYFKTNYENTQFKLNTYILFCEKSYYLLNQTGYFGFIIPNTWLTLENTSDFRKFILDKAFDIKIVNSYDKIFKDANVDTSILIFSKAGNDKIEISELKNSEFKEVSSPDKKIFYNSVNYIISTNTNESILNILSVINKDTIVLSDITNVNNGILAYEVGAGKPKQTTEIRDKRLYHSYERKDNEWIKYLDGIDVKRYFTDWSKQYVKYGKNLSRQRKADLFIKERILVRQIPSSPPYSILATYTNEHLVNDNNSMIITLKSNDFNLLYLLSILNSRLMSFWFLNTFDKMQRKLFPQFKVKELSLFPIKSIPKEEQQPFIEIANKLISINEKIHKLTNKFNSNLIASFDNLKLTQKLNEFYMLEFKEFINELNNQSCKIALKQKDEWFDYFNEYKNEISKLITAFSDANKITDYMVYKLYNLSQKEIEMIENK